MKQRKNIVSLLVIVVLVGAAALPYLRHVVAAQPGDAHDPLVTRRYVDERIHDLWNEIQAQNAQIALLQAMVEAGGLPGIPGAGIDLNVITQAVFTDIMFTFEMTYGEMLRAAAAVAEGEGEGERSLEFTILELNNGQRLVLENGTEVILRTGSALVFTDTSGLVDMTTGVNIDNGANVGRNHLIISPRTDGRGIHITSNYAWVMVRGGFTLE